MGIQSLEIEGFRSLRDVLWKPGRLNVLIGPNGSGKSNLLDACTLLKDAGRGKLSEGILRRGGMGSILWDGQQEDMSWELCLAHHQAPLRYGLELVRLGMTSNFTVRREDLLDDTEDSPRLDHLHRGYFSGDFRPGIGKEVTPYPDPLPPDQTLLYLVSGPLGNPAANELRHSLESWSIYQGMRVDSESQIRQSSVARFEKRIDEDGQNLIPVLHTLYSENREFKSTVDTALRAAFGRDYEELSFPPAADQRVQLRLRWRSLKSGQPAANLSDGTLRFLLLSAILANPEPGDLIAIDEPETGLHPSMFPILAELAAEAAERTQVVFTTHSPQFLDAFRDEPPTTTVAEWVDGETRLSTIDGEELRRWLESYSLGSLFRAGDLEGLAS
jgi:predicted ATPase